MRRPLAALLAASLAFVAPALRRSDPQTLEQAGGGLPNGELGAPGLYLPWKDGLCPEPKIQDAQRSDNATDQDPKIQNFTDGSLALPVFKNVLLVLHCRAPTDICSAREWVFRRYAPYFGDVFYMTQSNHCEIDTGDPNVCLARLMEARGAGRDGVLYAHFDALLNPVNLALGFDKHAIYSFYGAGKCTVADDLTHLASCDSGPSGISSMESFLTPWRAACNAKLVDEPLKLRKSNNDVFYVPREAYALWGRLARGLALSGLIHEISGPTLRIQIAQRMHISHILLNCSGSCLARLPAEVALRPGFKCGHSFNLSDHEVQQAIPEVIDHR